MALSTSSTQLGCGRDIDQVWEHLQQPPDDHEVDCPYCQGARRDLQDLAHATSTLRAADEARRDSDVDPKLVDRILALARAEVRYGRRLPLDPPVESDTGGNTVSEQAVAAVVRRAGDRTRQVQIRRCTITVPAWAGPAPVSYAVGSGDDETVTVAVALRVSVRSDVAIVAACDAVRRAVIDAVRSEVGVDVVAVDITVEDLHDD